MDPSAVTKRSVVPSTAMLLRCLRLAVAMGLLVGWPTAATALKPKEQRFGFHTDRAKLSSGIIVFHDALNRQINAIGQRLARVSRPVGVSYTFRVMNDSLIDASSAAGGFVYLNTGLLDVLEREDEVAAVIAHELAHITESHQLKFVESTHRKAVVGSMVSNALSGALSGLAASAVPYPAPYLSPEATLWYQWQQHVIGNLGAELGWSMGEALTLCMITGYGKRQELAADARALQYLRDAGYDPYALIRVFQKLKSIRDRVISTKEPFLSHLANAEPGLERRIKNAERRLGKLARTMSDEP